MEKQAVLNLSDLETLESIKNLFIEDPKSKKVTKKGKNKETS